VRHLGEDHVTEPQNLPFRLSAIRLAWTDAEIKTFPMVRYLPVAPPPPAGMFYRLLFAHAWQDTLNGAYANIGSLNPQIWLGNDYNTGLQWSSSFNWRFDLAQRVASETHETGFSSGTDWAQLLGQPMSLIFQYQPAVSPMTGGHPANRVGLSLLYLPVFLP
jgi:hypothetical protein